MEVWDEEKQQTLVFLTNHFDFGASTVAAIYKERWQIELFFKAPYIDQARFVALSELRKAKLP